MELEILETIPDPSFNGEVLRRETFVNYYNFMGNLYERGV